MYLKQLAPLKLALASLLLGLLVANGASAGTPKLRADGIVFPVAPSEKISTGSVEVMIAVDKNGDTASVTVLSATHQSLEDAVTTAVKRWKFDPATSGGEPSIGMLRHAFRYEEGRFVVDEALLAAFPSTAEEPKIRPEGIVLPKLPDSLQNVTGTVELKAAVDGEGRVVDVITTSSSNAALEALVKAAISAWRFDPVTRDGVPVGGIYRHTFRYTDGQEQFDGKLWTVLSAASHVPTLRPDGIVLPIVPEGVNAVGKTEVLVAVNGEGRVASVVSVASTDDRLAAAMKKAISAWRFDPALSNGRPVVGLYRHAFSFDDGRYVLSDEIWSALSRNPAEPELLPIGLELPKIPSSHASATGKVNLLVAVNLTGEVVDVMASSATDDVLVDTIATAVRKWNFKPAMRDGKAALGLFDYVFRYEDGEPLIGPKLWNAMRQATPVAAEPKPEIAKKEIKPTRPVLELPTTLPLAGTKTSKDRSIEDLSNSSFTVLRAVDPELPTELSGVVGQVNVIFDLSKTGVISMVTVEDYTHEELVEYVMRVAHRWQFLASERASASKVRVPFVFNEKRDRYFSWDRLVDAEFGNVEMKPQAIRRYVPSIPANRSAASGEIQALVAIDSFGYVTAVEIERGIDRRVDKEATEALYRWTFEPASVGGRALDVKKRITLLVNNGLASIDNGWIDVQPEPLSSPLPRINASDPRMQGFVLLRLRVDAQGFVTDTRVVESTNERLIEPSLDASKQWRFTPAKAGGRAVSSTISVPFVYPTEGKI